MGEPTKTQIEAFAQSPYHALAVGDFDRLCALAIEALDTRSELATLRKDAAIGAKVRTWIGDESADQLDEFADVLSQPMFLGSETSPAVELVRTIASALREEGR